MTDGHTKRKLFHEGYEATLRISDRNSDYLKLTKYFLKSQPNIKHSCSKYGKKSEENDWLMFLLSFGLKQTISEPNQTTDLKNGNSFLTLAKLDDPTIPFVFPKSLTVMKNGSIIVCDTGNHRIIGFNSGGIQTFIFDHYEIKNEKQPLSIPLSVCTISDVYVAVANYSNSLINILTHHGTNKLIFICKSKPIALTSDSFNVLYVLTDSQHIECYSKSGKLLKDFKLSIEENKYFTIMTCHNKEDEIYLSESNSNKIFVINKNGNLMKIMKLNIDNSGLNLFISNMCYTNEKILVADSVNRSVFSYKSDDGKFLEVVINGKKDLGCVQAVSLSNENQLITSEYSLNQLHLVKIFSCRLK